MLLQLWKSLVRGGGGEGRLSAAAAANILSLGGAIFFFFFSLWRTSPRFQPRAEPEPKNGPTCFRHCVGWTDGAIWARVRRARRPAAECRGFGGCCWCENTAGPLGGLNPTQMTGSKSRDCDLIGLRGIWNLVKRLKWSVVRPGGTCFCRTRVARSGGTAVKKKEKIVSSATVHTVGVNWLHITLDLERKIKKKKRIKITPPAPKTNTPHNRVNIQAAWEAGKANQASHWVNLVGSAGAGGAPGCRLAGGAGLPVSHHSQGRISESEASSPRGSTAATSSHCRGRSGGRGRRPAPGGGGEVERTNESLHFRFLRLNSPRGGNCFCILSLNWLCWSFRRGTVNAARV